MTIRRLALALGLALLAGGGIASVALNRPDPLPEAGLEEYQCTTCDARAAGKKRLREALQAKAAEKE